MASLRGRHRRYVGDFCCVPGCTNSRGKCKNEGIIVSFHKIPQDEKRRTLWLDLIRRDVIIDKNGVGKQVPFTPKPSTRICSVHFIGGTVSHDPAHPAYVPTIFPRNAPKELQTNTSKKAEMFTPLPKNRKRSLAPPTPTPDSAGRPKIAKKLDHSRENNPNSVWCTTDHDYIATPCESSDVPHDFQSQTVSNLQDRFEKLQGKLLRIENIKNNDTKFQFWTNLPNYAVFTALSAYLKTRTPNGTGILCYWRGESTQVSSGGSVKGPTRKLTFEDELFLVLIKLKTGKFNEDLAHTFDISPGHVSNIFSTWINFLSNELKLLFEMQNSEDDIADCYKPFGNLKVVLDCTALMVQRATNLDARKKTFSNYKHHDTMKFLVGISPNLAVNYVSRAWGGRASDKHITLNSEQLMNGLTHGDTVMADRGFLVTNELKQKGVQLIMPEFKGRDRAQFSAKEAKNSEFISSARIHIERVIQRIKTFSFLEKVIRLNMQDIVEQIFLVCAYLTNFQLPIIKR